MVIQIQLMYIHFHLNSFIGFRDAASQLRPEHWLFFSMNVISKYQRLFKHIFYNSLLFNDVFLVKSLLDIYLSC